MTKNYSNFEPLNAPADSIGDGNKTFLRKEESMMMKNNSNDFESSVDKNDKIDEGKLAELGCPYRVRQLIYPSVSLETTSPDPPEGTHPLLVAAILGDWESFKKILDADPSLIEMKCDVNIHIGIHSYFGANLHSNSHPCQCFCSYMCYYHLPLIYLIITWPEPDSETAIRYLADLGCNLNRLHLDAGTPLFFAVNRFSSIKVLETLLSVGATELKPPSPMYHLGVYP